MPSEPESGPTMMSTLSCSTSLRVALTATSGLASDDALMISIFLPATIPLRCLTASSAPRMPSWPPAANGPSRVASRPILTTCWASAIPATATAHAPAARIRVHCLVSDFIVPSLGCAQPRGYAGEGPGSCLDAAAQPPLRRPRAQTDAGARPPAEQAVGREQHDDQEHAADQQVEPLAVHQVDGEDLHQHEHDGADEGPARVAQAAQA